MKNNKVISKIIDGALNVLIVLLSLFLLVSLYTAVQVKFLKSEYANFFGYSLFEVETGSMHGTIEAGDWIIVKGTKDAERNDIITYKHGKEFVTHRVVEIYKGSYITKGDANNTKDDPIDREQVVGKVVHILHGFGILKKIFFNPFVIIFLIICLYLFNLTFKTGESEFDIFMKKMLSKLKKKKEEDPDEWKDEPIQEESKVEQVQEETPVEKEEQIELPQQVKEEEVIATKIETEEEKQEELSKTAVFRMINTGEEEAVQAFHEEEQPQQQPEITPTNEENLSKTSVFRIISVEEEDEATHEQPVMINEEEIKPKKVRKTRTKKIQLNAEVVTKKENQKEITKKYIQDKINSKKAKNILDKTFMIKRIVYEEILDVLLEQEASYIQKSSMRKQFMDQYMNSKYFGLDSDRENLKDVMKSFSEELTKKNIRDERKVKTVEAYSKAFTIIDHIESKTGTINYKKEINSFKKFDEATLENMEIQLYNIVYYSTDSLNEILEKLKTSSFKEQYKKIEGQKDLYGVELKHNIAFSRVYSNYIVDKTYTEGIVAEDKIAVLLNMLMCKITKDIMNHDYDSKYIVYIPNALYGKDKKLDKIVSTINNDYAKTHIFFLTTATNMFENEDDFNRLSKKGYHFALSFNKPMKYNSKNMGYIYLADYYFIDTNLESSDVCKNIPQEIKKKLIKEDLIKKIGDYKGD